MEYGPPSERWELCSLTPPSPSFCFAGGSLMPDKVSEVASSGARTLASGVSVAIAAFNGAASA